MRYRDQIRALLSPAERRVFGKLKTPELIQDYLDALPQNFSYKAGETHRSPRRILQSKASQKAYCFEGAVLAAAALAYHGHPPLLLDLQTDDEDEDHVLALFSIEENIRHTSRGNSGRKNLRGGRKEILWGAISKTNHPVLRWRDPVYKSVRELAMSYFHEYFLPTTGRKTLYAYSKPFDLSKVAPECWVTSEGSLDWLAETLDASPHYPVAPKSILRRARRASMLEREASKLAQWHKPAKRTWGLS